MQCSSFMGQPERLIENAIFAFLKLHKIYCWKTDSVGIFNPTRKVYMKSHNPHRTRGISDILGILPDAKFLALEVKAPKGYPTIEQKNFIAEINSRGGIAAVVRSVDEVKDLLTKNGYL